MKVGIIAGHMSETAGKRTPPFLAPVDIDGDGTYDVLCGEQYREHYANVGVAAKLNAALIRCGIETAKIGWNDENPKDDTLQDNSAGLAKRQAMVKAAECDISVAVHFNAFGDGMSFNSATGVCTYIHINPLRVGDSAALAALVQARLIEGVVQVNRGVHADAFAEVNCAAMGTKASVLVELAFMTNQQEAEKLMANEAFWIESAEEICHAICEYAGVAYITEDEEMFDINSLSNEEKVAFYNALIVPFKDNDSSQWSAIARQWAIDNGLIKGTGTPDATGQINYQFEAPLTREAAITMFYRFAQFMGKV